MEVTHVTVSRSLNLNKTPLPTDPYQEFKSMRVTYKKKLQPKVDVDFRLERLGAKGIDPLTKKKMRGGKKGRKKATKGKLPAKPETETKRGRMVAMRLNNDHRVQHNLLTRKLPALLLMPYKPLPNMLPTQTHDINISYGLRDYQNGLYPSAVAKFTKALRIKPWGVVPRFVRGLCWAQMGNNKKAADDFRVAQEEGGKEAAYNLGLALAYSSDIEGSIEAFSEAMRRGRNTEVERDSLRNRSLILRTWGRYGDCIKDLGQLNSKQSKVGKEIETSFVDTRPMSQSWSSTSLSQFSFAEKDEGKEQRATMARRTMAGRKSSVNRVTMKGPRATHRASTHMSIEDKLKAEQKKIKEKLYGLVHIALTTPAKERDRDMIKLLTEECKMMKAFEHLDTNQISRLWKHLTYRRFNSGIRLFEEGEEADKFYVIWSGQVSARIDKSMVGKSSAFVKKSEASLGLNSNEEIVNVMNVGETLGEAVDGGVRMASCVTEKVTELLVLERDGFLQTFKLFFEELDRAKQAFLITYPFFSKSLWEDEKLFKTAHFCRERVYRAGETIIHQDAPADGLYFIMKGMVAVSREVKRENDNSEQETLCNVILTKLCTGGHFGETTILDQESVNPTFPSTVTCETKVKVLRLDKSQLDTDAFLEEGILKALKDASYTYPDDNFILQSHIDVMRNMKRTRKVMAGVRGTMKNRGRKDEKDMD